MADELVKQESNISDELCVICATVTLGLERICARECEQKLRCAVVQGRGRIYIKIPRKDVAKIKELRSVENLFVVVADIKDFDCFGGEAVQIILGRFYQLPDQLKWQPALALWREFTGYLSDICVEKSSDPNETPEITNLSDDVKETEICEVSKTVPSFRVTCTRTHSAPSKKHTFTSMEAATQFGGGINDFFGWKVDLENFDLEVLLNIVDNHVVVGISLTKESLFKRNIVNFGPTTLRSTLAYCLATVAEIKPGDIVCDPMCGGGSISVESAINWPGSFNICGDNFEAAPTRTLDNINFVNGQRATQNKGRIPVDTLQWDTSHLPLKTKSVDVVITDLPFGKKSGSLMKNWQLYPQALMEMARVCQPSTGRAVLLTKDKKVITKVLNQHARLWKKKYTYWVNFGGLQAGIYVLQRTSYVLQ